MALALIALPAARWRRSLRCSRPTAPRPWLLPAGGAGAPGADRCWRCRGRSRERSAAGSRSTRPGGSCCCCSACSSLVCAFYAVGYLRYRPRAARTGSSAPCLLAFLGMMSLVACVAAPRPDVGGDRGHDARRRRRSSTSTARRARSRRPGSTCSSARSASRWRCSARSSSPTPSLHAAATPRCCSTTCSRRAGQLSKPWLQAAFVLLLVGYGTKMGLAPMHTWKPDAYGEAPGVVGALLAGGVTSCAFLALAARLPHLPGRGRGRLRRPAPRLHRPVLDGRRRRCSWSASATSSGCWRTRASSTWGSSCSASASAAPASFGALLHMLNNGLTKGVLFLSAATSTAPTTASRPTRCRGAMRRLPLSGTLFLLGFFAITGSPPFGPFVSEFPILNGAIAAGALLVAAGCPALAAGRVHRHGRHGARGGAGRAVARGRAPELPRRLPDRRAGRWCSWRSCCMLGLSHPGAARARCSATRRASSEARP